MPESVKSVHGLLIFTIKSFSISCMHNWVNANYWKVLSNCLESMKSMFATWEYKTGWVLLTQFPLFSCQLLTNVKDMDKPKKRWRAVYEIYCSYCQGSILERLAKTSDWKTDWTQADDKERWFQLSDSIDLWTPLFTGTMHNALPTALTTFNDLFWKADSLT